MNTLILRLLKFSSTPTSCPMLQGLSWAAATLLVNLKRHNHHWDYYCIGRNFSQAVLRGDKVTMIFKTGEPVTIIREEDHE